MYNLITNINFFVLKKYVYFNSVLNDIAIVITPKNL